MIPINARWAGLWFTGRVNALPSSVAPVSDRSLLSIVRPREHGSWSLAFEPLVFGLLAAPSVAGGLVALAVIAGFFARRPLQMIALAGDSSERIVAWRLSGALVLLVGFSLAGAGWLGGLSRLWPLIPAAVLGTIFLWYDLRRGARTVVAEVAGAAAFGFIPAVCATLAGRSVAVAAAMAAVMLARAVPTVLFVRCFLRVRKGRSADPMAALAAAGMGFLVVGLLAWRGLVPSLAVVFTGVLLARVMLFTLMMAAPLNRRTFTKEDALRRPDDHSFEPGAGEFPASLTARSLGIQEAVLGAIYAIVLGFAMRG